MNLITIIRPGMLTTIQDLGRWGQQHLGIPVAGPMDEYSHRLANRLVGNDEIDAALEVTLIGPEIEIDEPVTCAVSGARFSVSVSGVPVPLDAAFDVPAGGRLRFGERASGARATLAVSGGIAVPRQHGSRATSLMGRIGPFGGRALRAGDVLPVGAARSEGRIAFREVANPLPDGGVRLRILDGPHADRFDAAALDTLRGARFTVTTTSNRTAYRLAGPELRPHDRSELLSSATPIGTLQVPASGQPILLMADRQTTGGYPRIATVISADLPLAGQLAPGDWIEFSPVTRDQAIDALRQQRARLGVPA